MLQPSLELQAPFVDREKERSILKGLFDKIRAGNGCTILLIGEGGVGKTRLVKEFAEEVRSAGSLFVEGASFEQEGAIPYSPWVEIVQHLLKKIPPATFRKIPEWAVSEIGAIVPQILSQAEHLGLKAWLKGPRAMSTLLPSTDQDRIRLFQALSELFSLVEDMGVVVFLDDLLWADPLSLQMFHYLARRTSERRMMLIGAYRDMELHDDHPLAVMMRDLGRHRISHQMTVGRFTDEHVSSLLMKQLGGPVSKELSQLIYSRTRGNPFFVEEIVHNLAEQTLLTKVGDEWTVKGIRQLEIPSSVRTIIKQRTMRLSEESVQLLSIASLIGMEFDYDILRQASGMTEEASMALLEAAVKARLVLEKRAGGKVVYGFVDEQVLDFFSEQLSLLRARKYHAAIGRAMEEAYESRIEDRLGELAYHFVEGASIDKAREYSLKAGDRSARLHAHSDAIRHWTNALELLAEDDLGARLALFTKLAWSAWALTKHDEVLRFCGKAIEIAQKLGSRTNEADLYGLQGVSHFILGGSKELALESYAKGLEALKGEPDVLQEAKLLHETARVYVLTGEESLGLEALEKAIAISSRFGAYEILANSYLTLALAIPRGRKDEAFSYIEKALRLAEEHDLYGVAVRACNNLSILYAFVKADSKRAEQLVLKGREYAERYGSVDQLVFLRGVLARVLYSGGQWEKSERVAREAIQLIGDVGGVSARYLVNPYVSLASILIARGDFQKAGEFAEESVSMASGVGWSEGWAAALIVRARLRIAQGNLDLAKQDLLTSLEHAEKLALVFSRIDGLFFLVVVSLKMGKLEEASAFSQELHKIALVLDESWGFAFDKWAQGLVSEARGEIQNSLSLLAECIGRWTKVERPYELARAYMDHARVQEKAGLNAEAKRSLGEAQRIFAQLKIPG